MTLEERLAIHLNNVLQRPEITPVWADWFGIRDTFLPELRQFVDDKLRSHSRGAVEFEVLVEDSKYYVALKPKSRMNYFSHLIFYKSKDSGYEMLAVSGKTTVSKGMMMLSFSEALQSK